jgi:hypothetical protein
MKKQKNYEYMLPEDNTRLAIDATVYAGIDAIRDGPNMMSREVIAEKARRICEQFKTETKAEYVSNNIDAYKQIIIESYTTMYLKKQENYRADITAHQQEVEMAKKYGSANFHVYYRIFVEKAVWRVK